MIKPLKHLYEPVCQSSLIIWTLVTLELRAQMEGGRCKGDGDKLSRLPLSPKIGMDTIYKECIAANQMKHKT